MNIHNEPTLFNQEQIKIIEDKYNGKYVFESALKTKDGRWTDRAFAIFYTEEPHPQGSNYFAIGRNHLDRLIIADGISATDEFEGVLYNNEVYYSRFCHDFRQFTNGLFVDGGRDYTRYGGSTGYCTTVKIRIVKDHLEVDASEKNRAV